jgi:hypothetical protein
MNAQVEMDSETAIAEDEALTLEQLELSGSKILDRIASKIKQSSDTSAHSSHSSHGSGSHTSSS